MKASLRFTGIVVAGTLFTGWLLGSSIAALEPEITLRYLWNKGESLKYRVTQQATTTVSGLPAGVGNISIDQTLTQVVKTLVADSAADGTTTLRQSIESMRMEINSPTGQTIVDTAADANVPPSGPIAGMLSALTNEPFDVVLLPTGAVQKIEGFSRLIEKISSNVPPGGGGAAMWNTIKGLFNDESLRTMMPQGAAVLADHPLTLGETWTTQFTTTNPATGPVTTALAATLNAIEGSADHQVATITIRLTMIRDAAAPAVRGPMGTSVEIGESSGEGEIRFDVSGGKVLRSVLRSTMPMSVSGPAPDGTPMTMHSTVNAVMTVELITQ
jgi:hypothetical protein